MNDISYFWKLTKIIEENESTRLNAESTLEKAYSELVRICPHPEAIDWKYYGIGVFRVCTVCGLEDMASDGGTPGDEYNYGTNGAPNEVFWRDTNIINASSEEEHCEYRRRHHWTIEDGKIVNKFL